MKQQHWLQIWHISPGKCSHIGIHSQVLRFARWSQRFMMIEEIFGAKFIVQTSVPTDDFEAWTNIKFVQIHSGFDSAWLGRDSSRKLLINDKWTGFFLLWNLRTYFFICTSEIVQYNLYKISGSLSLYKLEASSKFILKKANAHLSSHM